MPQSGLKTDTGFTLVELMVAMAIAITIACWAGLTLMSFVSEKSDERKVVAVWKEFKGLRMKALKTENVHKILFNNNSKSYQIYQVTTGGDVNISAQDVPVLIYGIPDNCTGLGPAGISLPSGGISTQWAANGIRYNNDFMGRIIESGSVIIKSSRNPKIGYCIMAADNSQDLKLYKYRGGAWFEM